MNNNLKEGLRWLDQTEAEKEMAEKCLNYGELECKPGLRWQLTGTAGGKGRRML